MVAKAPPPAVVYNWTRNRRLGIGPSATTQRNRQVAANGGILTFTYH